MPKMKPKKGSGGVYLRGRIWHIHYSKDGIMRRESAKTEDRSVAEKLLARRTEEVKDVTWSGFKGVSSRAAGLLSREQTFLTIGAISELIVATDLMNHGHAVYRSLSPNAPFDLVSVDPDTLQVSRVEVKTGTFKNDRLHKLRSPLDGAAFDLLAVVSRSGHIVYSREVPKRNPRGRRKRDEVEETSIGLVQ